MGSRLYVAGNIVGLSGPLGRDFNPEGPKTATKQFVERINPIWEENTGPDLGYMTPEQARLEIRKYIERGIDFLKYASSGHIHERFLLFSAEVQKVIVDECHKAGLSVQAHTTSNESLRIAVESGVDHITHVSITGNVAIPESTISEIKKRQITCGIFPPRKQKEEKDNEHEKLTRPSRTEISNQNTINVIKAGIPIVLSTDGGLWDHDYMAQFDEQDWRFCASYPGEGLLLRCINLADIGVSAMNILISVTRNTAIAYHKLEEIGTIEKGKLADLVVLDDDPLANIENIRKISMVMKDGKVIDTENLPLKKILYPPPYRK